MTWTLHGDRIRTAGGRHVATVHGDDEETRARNAALLLAAPLLADAVGDLIRFSFSAHQEVGGGYRKALGRLCEIKRAAAAALPPHLHPTAGTAPAREAVAFVVVEDDSGAYPACPKCDEPLALIEDVDRRYSVKSCSPGGNVVTGNADSETILGDTGRNLRLYCPTCTEEHPLPAGGVEW